MRLLSLAALAMGASSAFAISIPLVGSGTLVAHFRVSDGAVARNGSGHVTSWTADNNPGIILTAAGNAPGNITYNASGMNGAPMLAVADLVAGTDNQYMTGLIPGSLTQATIFWLGSYSGSGGTGRYVYSYGTDGVDGSQFDHQIEGGVIELFGGLGTQSSAVPVVSLTNIPTVWTTLYGQGTGNGHSAFANTANLNMPSPNGGNYNVSGNLVLFGYQSTTPGQSAGFNFQGAIGELIIYNGLLSPGDITAIQTYLNQRAAGNLGNPGDPVPEPAQLGLTVAALAVLGWRMRR